MEKAINESAFSRFMKSVENILWSPKNLATDADINKVMALIKEQRKTRSFVPRSYYVAKGVHPLVSWIIKHIDSATDASLLEAQWAIEEAERLTGIDLKVCDGRYNYLQVIPKDAVILKSDTTSIQAIFPDTYQTLTELPTRVYVLTKNLTIAFSGCKALKKVSFAKMHKAPDSLHLTGSICGMFNGCNALEEIDMLGLKDAKFTNAKTGSRDSGYGSYSVSSPFLDCGSLTKLNAEFDLINMPKNDMSGFFSGCPNLSQGSVVFKNVRKSYYTDVDTFLNTIGATSDAMKSIITVNMI